MLRKLTLFMVLLFTLLMAGAAQAATTPLPASPWYAVAWVQATDTLHWINANGQQASIQRPALEGEISLAQTRMHISPNGRTLLMITPLLNGREAIAFYNLEQGVFTQVHETQPNEVVMPAGRMPFSEFSMQVVLPLRNQITGAWRMIAFETQTGNVVAQLNHTDGILPPGVNSATTIWPYVMQFNVDEAINTLEVRFKMVTTPDVDHTSFASLKWVIPPGGQAPFVSPDQLTAFNPAMGYDFDPMTGEGIFVSFDPQFGAQPGPNVGNTVNRFSGGAVSTVASEGSGRASSVRWLNNGTWFGYYRQGGALAAHWNIRTSIGEGDLPLSPNIIDVYHTNDGLLAKNSAANRLSHLTSLNGEAFAEPVGNTVFEPGSSFAVIYTTPASTAFELPAVSDLQIDLTGGIDDIAAPGCPGAPVSRLEVGDTARVTFTDGAMLRVRSVPGGDIVAQIPEGTAFDIIGGPDCQDGFVWWNIRLGNGTTGWSAEGDLENYFMEPWSQGGVVVVPPPVLPTSTPLGFAPPPVVPTQPGFQIAPINPTATPRPPRAVAGPQTDCTNSPASQLQVGIVAHTSQFDGTLAVYINLADEIPLHQIPGGINVMILDGPECRNNIRMWYAAVTLNGQQVNGWIAEGANGNYFLQPGPYGG